MWFTNIYVKTYTELILVTHDLRCRSVWQCLHLQWLCLLCLGHFWKLLHLSVTNPDKLCIEQEHSEHTCAFLRAPQGVIIIFNKGVNKNKWSSWKAGKDKFGRFQIFIWASDWAKLGFLWSTFTDCRAESRACTALQKQSFPLWFQALQSLCILTRCAVLDQTLTPLQFHFNEKWNITAMI